MKKIFLVSVLAAGISISVNAQKLDAAKVPAAAKNSFAKQYPGLAAKWEKEGNNYEVNFKQNGQSMSVLMDANGTIAETETDIQQTGLPAGVIVYVEKHYKGKKIKESAKITKADGTVNYEAEVGGKDLIFDSKGMYLNEAKN